MSSRVGRPCPRRGRSGDSERGHRSHRAERGLALVSAGPSDDDSVTRRGWRSCSTSPGGLADCQRLARCRLRCSGVSDGAGGCSPEGCRFVFGSGRQYARSRNSVGREADQDPGGDGCRAHALPASCRVICGCVMVRSCTRFARGVNQRIALRSPPRRFRPGFLCLSVLSGDLVNNPVRLGPRAGRFSNSGPSRLAAPVIPHSREGFSARTGLRSSSSYRHRAGRRILVLESSDRPVTCPHLKGVERR
jgi:hypothetical protein